MRISDWSSDVCSSDLVEIVDILVADGDAHREFGVARCEAVERIMDQFGDDRRHRHEQRDRLDRARLVHQRDALGDILRIIADAFDDRDDLQRSEEHTSELQSLMRNSYAVFCLKKQKSTTNYTTTYKR